ncbi:MAG TPA: DUF6609 family protein [Blastocatellia bacterium]|nr:DUF6609 family protein [Blastocatellia bacterium]
MFRSYVLHYPMTPYAGVFVATVGVCVIAGAVLPNHRASLVWIGFALGAMLLVAFGQIFSTGLHPPSFLQVSFLALAIVLEIAGFRYLMPIMRPRGERATLTATLGIVGVHFLVMLPAFGPLIGGLGFGCTLNAAGLWRIPAYRPRFAWFVDGCLKLVFGTAMIATSPILLG